MDHNQNKIQTNDESNFQFNLQSQSPSSHQHRNLPPNQIAQHRHQQKLIFRSMEKIIKDDDGNFGQRGDGMKLLHKLVDITNIVKNYTGPITASFVMNPQDSFSQELNLKIMNNNMNFGSVFGQMVMIEMDWNHCKKVKLMRKRNKSRFKREFQGIKYRRK